MKLLGKRSLAAIALIFAVLLGLYTITLKLTSVEDREHTRMHAALNASLAADEFRNDLERGVAVTETVKQLIIDNGGAIHDFHAVAKNLMAVFGEEAFIGRTGGDEFGVFLPGKTAEEAEPLIREARGDQKILFANSEMVRLLDCEDWDDFMAFTSGYFKNIVYPEDYKEIVSSTKEQLIRNSEEEPAYNRYRVRTKSGLTRHVIAEARFRRHEKYGEIFFVTILDLDQ